MGRKKTVQLRVGGAPALRANASALWGPKALDPLVDLDLCFVVEPDRTALKRLQARCVLWFFCWWPAR